MKIIDTHIHPQLIIELEKNNNNKFFDNSYIINNAQKKFINKMFCISTNMNDLYYIRKIAYEFFPYYFSVGIHPCDINNLNLEKEINDINLILADIKINNEKIIGIGEVGIDLYREENIFFKNKQIEFFIAQIELSILYNLPLIIHTRNANYETYDILKQYKGKIKGVIHAFGYDSEWAFRFIDLGFALGIGGIVTYPRNNYLREAIMRCGVSHIVLETDSPFLPIQSMRGKINYPEYCYNIGLYLSDYLKFDKDYFFNEVYQNTMRVFGLKDN